jgi:hypothetical protein
LIAKDAITFQGTKMTLTAEALVSIAMTNPVNAEIGSI